jgi:hypothetical protein
VALQRTTLGLGTLATQSGTFSGTSSGTNTGDQTITLTGNVTGSGTGSFATTIANAAVTYDKMQVADSTSRLVGSSATTTDLTNITLGNRLSMSATTLNVVTTNQPEVIGVACSDETTALTAGTAKATFRMPFAMTLTGVRGSVTTAATGGTLLTIDVNEAGVSVLSTKLTFDASEKTTTTAATAAVISDSALADDAEITIDIDAVGSTIAGAGLKVWLIGTRA